MYYLLAGILIAYLIAVEGYCGLWLYDYFKERKERRKAAAKALIRQRVHTEWTVERNRNSLWQSIEK